MKLLVLKDVYGDEYLLKKSQIYRNARRLAKEAGYRFVFNAEDYFNWPLMHLPWIQSNKLIPYRRNLRAIKAITRRHKIPISKIMIAPYALEKNVLLHESVHCIAHEIFKAPKLKLSRGELFLFESFFGEACASSSEALMAFEASPKALHSAFIVCNSYIFPDRSTLQQIAHLKKEIGFQNVYEMLIHFYFLVNIRVGKLSASHLKAIESAMGIVLTSAQRKMANRIFVFASHLNPNFLETTNKYHFFLNGFTEDFYKTRDKLKRKAKKLTPFLQPHVRQFAMQLAMKR